MQCLFDSVDKHGVRTFMRFVQLSRYLSTLEFGQVLFDISHIDMYASSVTVVDVTITNYTFQECTMRKLRKMRVISLVFF